MKHKTTFTVLFLLILNFNASPYSYNYDPVQENVDCDIDFDPAAIYGDKPPYVGKRSYIHMTLPENLISKLTAK